MSYLQKSDQKPRKALLKLLFLLVAVFLVLLFAPGIRASLSSGLNSAAYPFWKIKNSILANSYLSSFFQFKASLLEENEKLKEDLLRAELRLKSLELITKENDDLKAIINRENLSEFLPVLVLARPPQTNYDFLTVDAGKNEGLSVGDKVSFESSILGEIVEVFSKTAKVRLYSSSGSTISAFIERIELPVKAQGRGSGNFTAEVPKNAPVEIGDFLVVLGSSKKLLGQVDYIEDEPAKSFKKIFFRFPINLNGLKWVAVEKLSGLKNVSDN